MKPFEERYRAALADHNVSSGLLEFQRAWRVSRDTQMRELEQDAGRSFDELRRELAAVKDGVIADLPRHVAEFRANAEAAGATVVEARSAAEANAYVAALCRSRDVELVVKGKSMVSEELELNEHLARAGVEAVETDLGEWLLQLAGERPSHLVMPAIHQRRQQVARLLGRALGSEFDPDDIPSMVQSARTALRERFLTAGMGLSGANALIVECGTIMLVTNEGNGRLATSLPPIHVATVGIEKLVPTFADAMRQVRLLARSATGQPISTYTTFITGPSPGHDLHIVLIDNGRSAMAADPTFDAALRCIRCGACANVCPPYQVVGGHAFGHIYTGAIGLVNTPFHHSLEEGTGPQSLCVSCGACATVCPVDIPLPAQILEVRRAVAESTMPRWRRVALRAYASRRLVGAAARLAAIATLPLRRGGFIHAPFARGRIASRTPPAIPFRPARSRRALARARPAIAETAVSGRRVQLFLQCLTDRLAPEFAVASAELLRAAGARVVVPMEQHCCGLPAFDAGDWESARRMARDTIEALEGEDDIVTPAPSCVSAMVHDYERLFRDEPAWLERARRLATRVHDLTSYLSGPARLPNGALAAGDPSPVTVHRFCQGSTMLDSGSRLEDLVTGLCGVRVEPLPEASVCCGFGGSTSLARPQVSAGILQRKLASADETGVRTLLTDNPGCVLHMRGGAHSSGRELRVLHIVEYLAARLPAGR